jgi:hypothetical protein
LTVLKVATKNSSSCLAKKSREDVVARRLGRLVGAGIGLAAIAAGLLIVPPWLDALFPPSFLVRAVIGFLRFLEATYSAFWAAILFAVPVLAGVVVQGRWSGKSRPRAARGLLLATSCLLGLAAVESIVPARQPSWRPAPLVIERGSELAKRFDEPTSEAEVTLAVLGESSARGVPYEEWLSVGKIVVWQLERAIPISGSASRPWPHPAIRPRHFAPRRSTILRTASTRPVPAPSGCSGPRRHCARLS